MGKQFALASFLALIVLLLDQLSKWGVSRIIALGDSVPLIPSVVYLTHIRNTGAGFGLFQGRQWLLIWISVIVLGVIFYLWDKIPEKKYVQIGVGFILGGTLGNLIDRLFYGAIVDFIDFRFWPAFNVADSALTIGAILLGIYFIRDGKK